MNETQLGAVSLSRHHLLATAPPAEQAAWRPGRGMCEVTEIEKRRASDRKREREFTGARAGDFTGWRRAGRLRDLVAEDLGCDGRARCRRGSGDRDSCGR